MSSRPRSQDATNGATEPTTSRALSRRSWREICRQPVEERPARQGSGHAFLRPCLVRQPLLLSAVLVSALFVMLFEGFGVGLLVPLLNLLLGGERATPMRPLQWLERTLPDHSPAFYIGAIAVAIVLAVALKNAAFYTSVVLAAPLKRRIAVRLRDDLFRRLHGADLDLLTIGTISGAG